MSEAQLRVGALLSIALLAVVLLVKFWEKGEEPIDTDETSPIWDVASSKVTGVEIVRADATIAMAKEGDAWRVTAPYGADADTWVVRDLINDVTDAKKGIPVKGASPAAVGLEPPRATVRLTTDDGAVHELLVGDATAVGSRTYVRGADGSVAAAPVDLERSVFAEPDAFRSHDVVRFEVKDVRRVTLVEPQGTIDVTMDKGSWWLAGFTRADPHKVEDLLLAAKDMRFDVFAAAGDPPIEAVTHTLTVAFSDGAPVVIRFGAPAPDGTPVEVEGGLRGVVATSGLSWLAQGPTDIGDQKAFPIDVPDATRLDVALGGTAWVIEKAEGEWTRGGVGEPAAARVIDAVAAADIDYAPTNPPPFTEVWGHVVFVDEHGERAIDLGPLVEDRWRAARDRTGGETYRVPVEDLDAISAAMAPG